MEHTVSTPEPEKFFIQAGTPASAGGAAHHTTDDDTARASEISRRSGLVPGTSPGHPLDERTAV